MPKDIQNHGEIRWSIVTIKRQGSLEVLERGPRAHRGQEMGGGGRGELGGGGHSLTQGGK